MIRAVAAEGADAVVILCTNLDGAALAASLERELDIAVLDSVAVTLWRTLGLAGGDIGGLANWGRIFQTSAVIK
jgi:maleate isomerase